MIVAPAAKFTRVRLPKLVLDGFPSHEGETEVEESFIKGIPLGLERYSWITPS